MRLCIFGAGAIGGLLAARLEASGIPVAVVVRGAHADAIAEHGLRLQSEAGNEVVRPHVIRDCIEAGPQDYLILAVKAQALRPALPQLTPLIGPQTTIVAAINGIPWWYCHALEGPLAERIVDSVDPEGLLWRALPPAQTLGAVVYPAAAITAPGVVTHLYGNRFSLGEADGRSSERANAFAGLLVAAGLRAPLRSRIRDEIWVKLWGNMAFNPVSVLTGLSLDRLLADPVSMETVRALMREGKAVADRLGVRLPMDIEQRIEGARDVGAHKTSMLQDFEAGRSLELDALLGAVIELAGWVDVEVPVSTRIYGRVKEREVQRDRQAGPGHTAADPKLS